MFLLSQRKHDAVKVAVYLSTAIPALGGSYTFQENVYNALVRCVADTRHEFVIYTNAALPTSHAEGARISYRKFDPKGLFKLRNRLALQINSVQDSLFGRRFRSFQTPFQAALKGTGTDIVWYVTPWFQECGMPFVYTVWDLQHVLQPWFPEVSENGGWESREAAFRRAILRATRVIVPNAQGEAELLRCYPVGPDRILRLTHPTPEFALQENPNMADAAAQKYGIRPPYLLYPAQFWAHKNHVTLLEAAAQLRKEGRRYTLVFVGSDQDNENYVRTMTKQMGLEDQVSFLGFVPILDLVGLYQGAFALTYVSLFGPENLPPLEAFALGCPVIASNVPGAQEQLGDAAILVGPLDATGVAQAVKDLEQSPTLREALIAKGHARAKRWTADDYVRGVLRFFDDFESIRRCWD